MVTFTDESLNGLTCTGSDFDLYWTAEGLPVPTHAVTFTSGGPGYNIYTDGYIPANFAKELADLLRANASDSDLLKLIAPNGVRSDYGSSDCETCGVNYDEVTWNFHGPDSVSWTASYGCFGGETGGPSTFQEALNEVPIGPTSYDSLDDKEVPGPSLEELQSLWAEHQVILDRIRSLDPNLLDEWVEFLKDYDE